MDTLDFSKLESFEDEQAEEKSQFEKDKELHKFFTVSPVKSSTFGSIHSPGKVPHDDGYSVAINAISWNSNEMPGKTKSRPRIKDSLGALLNSPGPGSYRGNDTLRSTVGTAPSFSLTPKRKKYVPIEAIKVPGPGSYDPHASPFDPTKREYKKDENALKSRGTLKWDSVGPGAYDPDALTTKYESCVSPIMPQRRSPRPRPRIENMERTVVQDRFDRGSTHAKPWVDEKIGPGKYNLHDDPRKIEFHKTIGLLPKKIYDDDKIGPGMYDPRIEFGADNCLATPLPNEIVERRFIRNCVIASHASHAPCNKVNPNYKSAYSFKKPQPDRMKKGRNSASSIVFKSM